MISMNAGATRRPIGFYILLTSMAANLSFLTIRRLIISFGQLRRHFIHNSLLDRLTPRAGQAVVDHGTRTFISAFPKDSA
jgi:hypothetical protein